MSQVCSTSVKLNLNMETLTKTVIVMQVEKETFIWTLATERRGDGETAVGVVVRSLGRGAESSDSISDSGTRFQITAEKLAKDDGREAVHWQGSPSQCDLGSDHRDDLRRGKGLYILYPSHAHLFKWDKSEERGVFPMAGVFEVSLSTTVTKEKFN